MGKLKKGEKVKVHYIGKLKDGTEFDNSRSREPIEFDIDDGNLLPAFNDAVKGLNAGDTITVDIPAKDAYGEFISEAVIVVNKSEFPEGMEFELKGFVQGKDNQGRPVQGQIIKIDDESINLDMNHPLAGEDLNFEIELVEVVG